MVRGLTFKGLKIYKKVITYLLQNNLISWDWTKKFRRVLAMDSKSLLCKKCDDDDDDDNNAKVF